KALEKDRDLRYQHASDVRGDLKRLKRETTSSRLVPVSSAADAADSPALVTPRPSGGSHAAASGPQEGTGTPARESKKIVLSIAAVAVALALGTWAYLHFSGAAKLTEKDTLVLADFDNRTGDTAFDDTLKQALAAGLAQSPFLNILSEQKVTDTLKMMGKQPSDRLTRNVAREIFQPTPSTPIHTGPIGKSGPPYSLIVHAVTSPTDDLPAPSQAEVADKAHVLGGLDKVGTKPRQKLGESLTPIQKYDKP